MQEHSKSFRILTEFKTIACLTYKCDENLFKMQINTDELVD